MPEPSSGLSLAPFRALRPAEGDRVGRLLCPPYDVISDADRQALLEADPDNAVRVILPRAAGSEDPYLAAAATLAGWLDSGLFAVDAAPALYVYELRTTDGRVTRGLLGAVELRDPADSVILPHENTMAGPVADRLALMRATEANLEPIYLVYDGGGFASSVVAGVQPGAEIAVAQTPDGTTHRLWGIVDPLVHAQIEADLGTRRALIADGHHRYATYRELQRELDSARGPGPWDRGLTLLVDSSSYGPQVEAIHRVVAIDFDRAVALAAADFEIQPAKSAVDALTDVDTIDGFAVVLSDGTRSVVVSRPDPTLLAAAVEANEPAALGQLDVTVLHRVLVGRTWQLPDTTDVVDYAHSVDEALNEAQERRGTAVLLRATPVAAVAAVAATGGRMPRKSTLFTPKPASGLVMRRFADAAG